MLASAAWAQDAAVGVLNLTCNIGSFKISNADGTIDLTFRGTVLVSHASGQVLASGSLKEEYKGHDRTAYFGTGKLIIKGKVVGVQWFGQDLTAHLVGTGMVRTYGEYDKDLNTGFYWYGDAVQKKKTWIRGYTLFYPQPDTTEQKAPILRPVKK
jgi:hypothetical protein